VKAQPKAGAIDLVLAIRFATQAHGKEIGDDAAGPFRPAGWRDFSIGVHGRKKTASIEEYVANPKILQKIFGTGVKNRSRTPVKASEEPEFSGGRGANTWIPKGLPFGARSGPTRCPAPDGCYANLRLGVGSAGVGERLARLED